MSADSDFLALLTEEHRAFEAAATALWRRAKASGRAEDFEPLRILCDDFLIGYHDEREEREIHPRLRGLPRLREGGPACTLHFDRFMNARPLNRAARVCARQGVAFPDPLWSVDASADIQAGSPLAIPGEDHEATRVLLRAIASQDLPDNAEGFSTRLALFAELIELRIDHHQREDTCFFPMCRSLVDPQTWREIGARDGDWCPPRDLPGVIQAITTLASVGWTRVAE
ncbi:MAG: hypothetical protein KF767_05785 [Bdellovibrionaceae bacterium]|nr:hypothetical protein [Pseudobdellovibrionaceae bacterium]